MIAEPPRPSHSQLSPSDMAPTHTRYWVVVFAVTLAIIQYIDRVCISQAAPFITKDLNLSKQQMGWVFSAFTLAYALFEIPAGYLGDKIGPRKVLLRIVLWWSFFTMATGWVGGLFSLVAVRFLFGAGEAGAFPNLTKAFSRWLPTHEKMRAQGIMWMSARWGGAFTPLLVFACLSFMSWRMAFSVFGAIGVVWALIFYTWYRDNPREHPGMNAAEQALLPPVTEANTHHGIVPWSKLLRSRTVWCLCGQYFVCSYCFYFFITWFPTYLLQERGLDMKQSALLAGTPLLCGGFGSLFAGWISPYLTKWLGGVGMARRGLGIIGFLGAATLLVVSTYLKNPYMAVAAIAFVTFFNDITLPGAWTSCMDVGGSCVGTLSGAMNMMGNIGGFLSPIVLGYIVGETKNWNLTFYVTASMYLLGTMFWVLMDPVTPLEKQVKD